MQETFNNFIADLWQAELENDMGFFNKYIHDSADVTLDNTAMNGVVRNITGKQYKVILAMNSLAEDNTNEEYELLNANYNEETHIGTINTYYSFSDDLEDMTIVFESFNTIKCKWEDEIFSIFSIDERVQSIYEKNPT